MKKMDEKQYNFHIFLTPLILCISSYIFFGSIIASFSHNLKIMNIIIMCGILPFYIVSKISKRSFLKEDFINLLLLTIVAIFFTVLAIVKNDGGQSEFSIFISILLARILIEDKKLFLTILKIVINVQTIAIAYEFFTQDYIYDTVSVGLNVEQVRTINIASYGDVGHRPKGLFSGPLEATSFYILCGIIFYRRIDVLLILLIISALSNGRLAILVCLSILIIFHVFKAISIKQLLVFLLSMLVITVLYTLQSNEVIHNWLSTISLDSPSNIGRVIWYSTGVSEIGQFNFYEALVGKGSYFQDKYQHSAESGVLNQVLIHGIPWTVFLMVLLFYKALNRSTALLFLILVLCFLIYRLEAGFMRATLLWFILLLPNKDLRKT